MLSWFVYPLSVSLCLAFLGLLLLRLRKQRGGGIALLLGFGWLYLCSTAQFADFLMGRLEEGYGSRALSMVEPAQAIVLLGGAARGHTHMGRYSDLNQHADRLVHAVELYRAGKAPLVIISGGAAEGNRPEASQIADLVAVMGVPRSAIVEEVESRNTYGNAVYVAQILRQRNLERVLLVTSAFHMRRAQAAFAAQGVDVVPAPTDHKRLVAEVQPPAWLPGVGSLSRSTYALHEIVGYYAYRLQGRL